MTPPRHLVAPPDADATLRALRLVGEALGTSVCYEHGGRFHFDIGHPITLAIHPESAGRFRIEACRWTRPRDSLFAFAVDETRLVALARELRDAVAQDQIGDIV